jgi:hypothetical protein
MEERALIIAAYEGDSDEPITGALAAYLALFHVCGPAAKSPEDYRHPELAADVFSIWAAAGPRARAVLRREGEHIVCPKPIISSMTKQLPQRAIRSFRRPSGAKGHRAPP